MSDYELTIVLPGEVSSAKKKSVLEKIEKLIKTDKGEVKKTDEWGKIELAYKIKKETMGVFVHCNLQMEGAGAKNLKDKLRLDNDIIRYLLVRI